jgi:hypothetical protein
MNRIFLLIIGIACACALWWTRAALLIQPDIAYLYELFGESQWRIPRSARIIADNELYQVASYAMVKHGSYFDINPEVPPMGKLLYGASFVWFGNPHFASVILWLGTLGLVYVLARQTISNPTTQLFVVALCAVSPQLAAQLNQTMLDLPQLFFLLLHIVSMFQLPQTSKWQTKVGWVILSGIGLGGFVGTKIALYAPLILLLDFLWLWRTKHLKWFFGQIIVGSVVYLLSYGPYLFEHGLIDLLKAQKWMLSFYQQSSTSDIKGMALVTIFTGWFKGWWENASWIQTLEWSLVWPLSLIASGITFITHLKNSKSNLTSANLLYLSGLILGLLAINSVIPFWPRYFLLMLPFGCVLLARELKSYPYISILILVISFAQMVGYFRASPLPTLQFAESSLNKRQFADVYNHLTTSVKNKYTRQEFSAIFQKEMSDVPEYRYQFALRPLYSQNWLFTNQSEAFVHIPSPLTKETNLPVKILREYNEWKIELDPEILP